jgi:hypothetical protein
MCFALVSNWEKLRKLSDSEDSVSFQYIQSIRAISMYLVVLGHVAYSYIIRPIRNPEFLENVSIYYYHNYYYGQGNLKTGS